MVEKKISKKKLHDDCWDFDQSCATWILPRLRYLKEHHGGYLVYSEKRGEKWSLNRTNEVWDQMIDAFELILDSDKRDKLEEELGMFAVHDIVQNGCEKFGKYFQRLWI